MSLTDDERAYALSRLELGAYYYSFAPTNESTIDLILGAVAAAGKSYHHTEDWDMEYEGRSVLDMIQDAAQEGADEITRLRAECKLLRTAHKQAVELCLQNSIATGHADDSSMLMAEVIQQIDEIRAEVKRRGKMLRRIKMYLLKNPLPDGYWGKIVAEIEALTDE